MNTKELTKAEAGIVVAQIAERLERFYKLVWLSQTQWDELFDRPEIESETEQEQNDRLVKIGEQNDANLVSEMNIPAGVLYPRDGLPQKVTAEALKLAKRWVAGKVSPEELAIEWETACDFDHWNIGWVFVEMPSVEFGYDGDDDESFMQFVRIGSRNFQGSKIIPPSPESVYMVDLVNKWNATCEG